MNREISENIIEKSYPVNSFRLLSLKLLFFSFFGYNKDIDKVGETEVDFVAEKPNDKLYILVTESMQSPKIRERELRPFVCL